VSPLSSGFNSESGARVVPSMVNSSSRMGSSIGSNPEPRVDGTVAQYASIDTVNSTGQVRQSIYST
jgi:hypothetical protein